MEKFYSIEKTIKLLSMKWNIQILKHLNAVPYKKRFNILLKELTSISTRTLSKRLKELEKAGLIKRLKYNEMPPRVEYFLTDSGKAMIKCFKSLSSWAKKFNNVQ